MANLNFIYNRKSIRKFKQDPIPREDLNQMLEAATMAPSPKHQQNWHFVVIENKDLIAKLKDVVEKSHIDIADKAKTQEEKDAYMRLLRYYTAFANAPVTVVVYGNDYDMIEYNILKDTGITQERVKELQSACPEMQAVGAAVQNMLLAATELGYASCYLTGPSHAKNEIEKLIGFQKEGYQLRALVALGLTDDPNRKAPPRKPLEKVVTYID